MVFPYYLPDKTAYSTSTAFKHFMIDTNDVGKIKCTRTDHGTEFVNEKFTTLLREHGIRRQLTGIDSSKSNMAVK